MRRGGTGRDKERLCRCIGGRELVEDDSCTIGACIWLSARDEGAVATAGNLNGELSTSS